MTNAVSALPRAVRAPGTPASERMVAVPARGRAFTMTLEAGVKLLENVRRGFAAEGFVGGTLTLDAVALEPFAYVMPALSKNYPDWVTYSETFRPPGVSRITAGSMNVGLRDNGPFFHAHALWQESDGRVRGGHILPEETVVAETIAVKAFGVDGAVFTAAEDEETTFKLFEPAPLAPKISDGGLVPVHLLRLRPNINLAPALAAYCAKHNITEAHIIGGIGSTIGARFADGREVSNVATEVFVKHGIIKPAEEGDRIATIEVGLVDNKGLIAEGILKTDDNPVLATFEIVLIPKD